MANAVDEFGSEAVDTSVGVLQNTGALEAPPRRTGASRFFSVPVLAPIALAVLLAGLVWAFGTEAWQRPSGAKVAIESTPPGAQVIIGDAVRGTTPLEIDLPAGAARIVVRAGDTERVLSLQLRGGETVRQHIEITPSASTPAATTAGTLEVTSEPARIALVIDGVSAGTTPLSATTLSAGEHLVSARFPSGTVDRQVRVEAGRTSTLHLIGPGGATGSVVGWLDVTSPLPLRILEEGRLLGTTDVDRVMLPVGAHILRFVNDETGFEVSQTVTVTAGRPTAVPVAIPTGTIAINARPWAEVFIDGERVGETPLGNVARPIGRHDVLLRHPELGERRQTVVISLRAPTRVSVDFQAR
ncbi:MAG TPA: PEGA domain-containing protein [Vicinamibacterales bacterium]